MQDCGNSSVLPTELPQSCSKPSVCAFSNISQQSTPYDSLWKAGACWSYKVETVGANVLAMQEVKSSAAMTLIYSERNIQTSAEEGLTHWGRVTHICVGNLTIIGPDNGLSPGRRQAIIWTKAGILLIWPWGTNFSEISIGIQVFSFQKMHLNMSSAKWRPFCLGLNVLIKSKCLSISYVKCVYVLGSQPCACW